VKHIGLAEIRGRRKEALAHMMKVNGISEKAAETEIRKAFETWHRRSGIKWVLDMSELEKALSDKG